VLKSGYAEVFVYDTTADENSVFSLNMGCRGVIRILLEPIEKTSEINRLFRSVWNERRRETIATYIGGDQGEKLAIGARVCAGPDERIVSDIADIKKYFPGIDDDLLTFHGSKAVYETMRYVNDAGEAEFAFEMLEPPVLLIVLGAGADAVPLAEAGHALGWQVRVVDHRPAFLTNERFPDADELRFVERDSTFDLGADEMTAIVSINHNYDRDKETLTLALRTEAFYIGALGPKKRTEQILEELRLRGDVLPADALARLRYPAGLDIGGDTPESIALSIGAEIQSVLKHRTGGALRDRNGAIYDRK
ncbi:MAG: XdhC family protein, partial [Acidobacteriota bacterium]